MPQTSSSWAGALRWGWRPVTQSDPLQRKIVEASNDLWMNGFGCFELLEDALAYSPGYQFFARDGDGICLGTSLKKVQFMCALRICMVQAMLFPKENLQTYTDDSGEPAYPGQELKLKHAKWLFDNYVFWQGNLGQAKKGLYPTLLFCRCVCSHDQEHTTLRHRNARSNHNF